MPPGAFFETRLRRSSGLGVARFHQTAIRFRRRRARRAASRATAPRHAARKPAWVRASRARRPKTKIAAEGELAARSAEVACMSACGASSPKTSIAAQPSSTLVAHQPPRQPSGAAMAVGVTRSALIRPMRSTCAPSGAKAQRPRIGAPGASSASAAVELARDQHLTKPVERPRLQARAVDQNSRPPSRGRPSRLTHGAAFLPGRARPRARWSRGARRRDDRRRPPRPSA